MLPGTYNFPSYLKGDTINDTVFTVTQTISGVSSPVDLTGAIIKAKFKNGNNVIDKTNGSGITVSDAINGVFQINAFSIALAGVYHYDIEFTFSDGTIRSYLQGTITIQNDVTS